MSSGKIVQIIGAVVDVEFPRESLPKVYDALRVDSVGLVLEVQQQLGDGIVRTIAMGTTDGLRRGLDVVGTGAEYRGQRDGHHRFGDPDRFGYPDDDRHAGGLTEQKLRPSVRVGTSTRRPGGLFVHVRVRSRPG
jgi:hypothetical protein